MIGIILAVLIGGILLLLYLWNQRRHSYWERRGIPQLKPLPFIGDMLSVITLKKNIGQLYEDVYFENMDKKYVGLYEVETPCLLVRDLKIIENILVKDFSYFVNRGVAGITDESDVGKTLALLSDSEWRAIRYKIIPVFSSGKLKYMFETMKISASRMIEYIDSSKENDIDVKEVTSRYALDIIGTCAFGIDISKDLHRNSKFREMGEQILNLKSIGYMFLLLVSFLPTFAIKIGLGFTEGKVGNYFAKLIRGALKTREKSKVKRNDLIDLLLQLREKGTVQVQNKDPEDSYLKLDYVPNTENIEITDQIIISQAYTFLQAGFDGISTPSCCILYELAKNSSIQDKVRKDIQDQIDKYGGLTYEAVKNAKYLDCCVREGFRLYPLTNFLLRRCGKDYEIEPGVVIEEGSKVVICNSASQIDPNYYTDPLVFNPDRYAEDTSLTLTDYSYLPFGGGPRMCIAMRFSELIMKLGLATILSTYRINLSPKAPKYIRMKIKTFFANQPADLINFSVTKLESQVGSH